MHKSAWHTYQPKPKSRLERRREEVFAESKERYFKRSKEREESEEVSEGEDGW